MNSIQRRAHLGLAIQGPFSRNRRTGLIRRVDGWQLFAVLTLSAVVTILILAVFI